MSNPSEPVKATQQRTRGARAMSNPVVLRRRPSPRGCVHHRAGPLRAAGQSADAGGDPGMQQLPFALEQRVVGRVLYQRVLEGVYRVWNSAPAEHQFRAHQLIERLVQSLLRQPGNGVDKFVVKFSSGDGADLGHIAHR